MDRRRQGRIGRTASVLVFGGAAIGDVDQSVADAAIQQALDAGVDSFDVAADYGDAELRMRPWAAQLVADGAFLATKTGLRERDAAWRQIGESLERMGLDSIDLLQLHAVGDLADLDRATGPGGALEAAVRARDEGLVRWIGITGHGHEAPATHREALRRFPFDAVLSPWNAVLARREGYRGDFLGLVEDCRRDDVALRTIKTVSRRNWPQPTGHPYATWYEPWDDEEHVQASVAFALRQDGVCGIPAAGDVRLLGPMIRAVERAGDWSDAEIERVLGTAPGYTSPFVSMPW